MLIVEMIDGLPVPYEFYKSLWDTISDDFFSMASKVFAFGHLFEFLNLGDQAHSPECS